MSLKITQTGGKALLSGFLDENSDLKPLEGAQGRAILNFKGITRVNSCGVREWVNLITKLAAIPMVYEECPMVVVKQMNAVPDFCGKATVTSFYAPYFCESCDEDRVALLAAGAVKEGQAPEVKCQSCGKPMEFDAIPGQYFSFLKRMKTG